MIDYKNGCLWEVYIYIYIYIYICMYIYASLSVFQYVGYARTYVNPKLTPAAAQVLQVKSDRLRSLPMKNEPDGRADGQTGLPKATYVQLPPLTTTRAHILGPLSCNNVLCYSYLSYFVLADCSSLCFCWQNFYLDLRSQHHSADSTPITTRQLESLIRLTQVQRIQLAISPFSKLAWANWPTANSPIENSPL